MGSLTFYHVFLITALYVTLFMAFYGWGIFTSQILKLDLHRLNGGFFPIVWIGWSTTFFIFQLLHFCLPIDWKASGFIYAFGLILAMVLGSRQIVGMKHSWNRIDLLYIILFLSFTLCALIWVAYRGMKIPENYDSGLYHFNSIRWINSYPIIPGLGNLHGRLAFNQTFFIYAASLNFFPYFPYAHSVANGFLFLLTAGELIWHLIFLARAWRKTILLPAHSYIPYIFGIFICAYWAVAQTDISSPTPDLASLFIQLILFVWFIRIIVEIRSHKFPFELVSVLSILAVTVITIKLSNLVFASILMAIVAFYAARCMEKREITHKFGRVLLLLFGTCLIWIIRGIYTSGYPFYPASFGGLPVSWAIPVADVKNLASWVYSWARMRGQTPDEVLGSWQWLRPWFFRLYVNYPFTIIKPVILSTLLIIFAFVISFIRGKLSSFYADLVFFAPVLTGLLFWFFSAPEPRFANALFFLLLLCAILVFTPRLYDLIGIRPGIVLLENVVLIAILFFGRAGYEIIRFDFQDEYSDIPKSVLVEKRTESGLKIYTPIDGMDQCWDAPLPCSPAFSPKLKLRVDGDLSSGFVIQ